MGLERLGEGQRVSQTIFAICAVMALIVLCLLRPASLRALPLGKNL